MKKQFNFLIAIIIVTSLPFGKGWAYAQINNYVIASIGGSGVANSVYYDYSVGESITLFGGTSCDSIFSGFQHVAIDTLDVKKFTVNVSGNGNTIACKGTAVTLNAPASTSYTWSNGLHTQAINATNTAVYTVTTTNSCGNILTSNPIAVSIINPPTPNICMVTVDTLSQYNEIYWEKTLYPQADSFFVYRETTANNYVKIGGKSKNDFSMYTDTNFSVNGPNGGNPNFSYFKYKLQLKDTCGNYSNVMSSPYHQSIRIIDAGTGTFNWNSYDIEGAGSPITQYSLKQRDISTGSYTLVGNTTGLSASDPQYFSVSNPNIKYFVDANGLSCNPTQKTSEILVTKTKTRSNVKNERLASGFTNILFASGIRITPNPATNFIIIEFLAFNNEAYEINVQNQLGQIVINEIANTAYYKVLTDNLKEGIYLLTIKQGKNTHTQKIIKQ